MATADVFRAPELAPLSNFATGLGFWCAEGAPPVRRWWPSSEHFLQAGKFAEASLRERVREAEEPGVAKALGRSLQPLRPDWDELRRGRVRQAMLEKLWAHSAPRDILLAIPDGTRIINGNPADPYFGTGGDGNGANVIGEELASLRAFFRKFPRRRQLCIKIADLGEPFEPSTTWVDMTGMPPKEALARSADALGLSREVIEGVELLTEGGFERSALGEFADALALEAFLAKNDGDCVVEVRLCGLARVTLWDGTDDRHLGSADLCHLCPSPEAVMERLVALQPLMGHPAFRGGVLFEAGADAGPRPLDAASFPEALAAASALADVVVSAFPRVPSEPQPPLRARPRDLGPPRAECGRHTDLSAAALADRVQGVVWGAALGDAVGLATEFMKKSEAAECYGRLESLGPTTRRDDKHRSRWSPGDWTDDTDQLVLLLDAVVGGGGLLDQGAFAASLKRWRHHGFPELGDTRGLGIGETVNSVLEHPAFDVAPDIASQAVWRQSGCSLAPNGAIMRCAGAALTYFWDEEAVAYNAAAGAAITHADPRCVVSCVAVATLVSRALTGVTLTTTARRLEEVAGAACTATRFLEGGDSDELWNFMNAGPQGLSALKLGGDGIGYTYKALGAACWAFVHAQEFKEAIIAITMEAGDADSNAAVAGALLGARFGLSGLPKDWLGELPGPQVAWLREKVSKCLDLLGLPMDAGA